MSFVNISISEKDFGCSTRVFDVTLDDSRWVLRKVSRAGTQDVDGGTGTLFFCLPLFPSAEQNLMHFFFVISNSFRFHHINMGHINFMINGSTLGVSVND